MTNKDKYIKDLDSLILRGVELHRGLYNELRDEYKDSFDKLSADEKESLIRKAKQMKNLVRKTVERILIDKGIEIKQ